ncbi:MAG: type II toxin-antitoxin system HipA family toxin [Epsilonproteobacteria bacterium]|nr:MAG: type II toxin-antitoxin system HipA family toxin [Campylobacterota bacterium]
MQKSEIAVMLYGQTLGYLIHKDNMVYFEYDNIFKTKKLEISPLKLATKDTAVYTNTDDKYFNTLAGVFADSLPDKFGNQIIDNYYEQRGLHNEKLNILQRLAYIGSNAMGALEYVPSVLTDKLKESLEIKHLVEEARQVLQGNIQTTIPEIMEAGASAGGARAKAIIQWNKTNDDIISGRIKPRTDYQHYLIKFDGVSANKKSEDYTKIEYIYMSIAKLCDLKVADVSLMKDKTYTHLLVKRFDRLDDKKIHMHSLCGMTHKDFNLSGLYSYEAYLQTVKRVVNHYDALINAYGHMIFNIIASNQDDHTKNFSFLMDERGDWDISPIYDLTYSHGTGYTSKHQMKVNGKQGDFTLDDLFQVAQKAGIKLSDSKLIIEHIQTIFYENFEKMAKELEVDKQRINRILSHCRSFDV